MELIGGSAIVDPLGQVIARAATTGHELVVVRIDRASLSRRAGAGTSSGGASPSTTGSLLQPVTEPHRQASP